LSRAEIEDKAVSLAWLQRTAQDEAEMRQVIARVWRLRDETSVRIF
jgi:DNA-binding FadR family transcriptional regulator